MNQSLSMVKYALGRFFNPTKVVSANIYKKEDGEIRVALTTSEMDHERGKNLTLYSDKMESYETAEAYIKNGCEIN